MKYLLIILLCILTCSACTSEKKSIDTEINISDIMNEDNSNYKKAFDVVEFNFPDDHYAHNDYKIEWWYFTGNLQDNSGHKFGYQFTIFRNGLSTDTIMQSSFDSKNIYLAHFALSDISNNKFYYSEKTMREVLDIAGADSNKKKIYIENWEIKMNYSDNPEMPTFYISAKDSVKEIKLQLIPEKKVVLHGNRGLSPKSFDAGNASYYYSYTNLKTNGKITINNENYFVNGKSWFDREWSTSALAKNQSGWDWFSLQMDDSTEIMCFRLRDEDNNTNFAKGTYIDKYGNSTYINANEFSINPIEYYTTKSGKKYPAKWIIEYIPKKIKLQIETNIAEQELIVFTHYYEGSVRFTGNKNTSKINGLGYVELTGYK